MSCTCALSFVYYLLLSLLLIILLIKINIVIIIHELSSGCNGDAEEEVSHMGRLLLVGGKYDYEVITIV